MNILVLDTETLGLADPRVYNLGYVVYDTEAHAKLVERDYVIKQIFDNAELMQTAYYADKKPLYVERLEDGACKKLFWGSACRVLTHDMEHYQVGAILAYNSRFDYNAILKTCQRYYTKRNPTADGIADIMRVIATITETKEYKDFCKAHGFLTRHKKPRCQKKAETLYRYLTGNAEYKEEHTALADSRIELAIYLEALKRGLTARA